MKIKFCCQHCGHSFRRDLDQAAITFAKNTNSHKVVEIWICPKCNADNRTEMEIPG